jgi:hypothetical protein
MAIVIRSWVPSGNRAFGIPSHSSSLKAGFSEIHDQRRTGRHRR